MTLRDRQDAFRQRKLRDRPNPVAEAFRYAGALDANPKLTKTQLARDLGISRVHLHQTLGILELPNPILDFVLNDSSTDDRTVFTKRRLWQLAQLRDETQQLAQFRQLLQGVGADG